MNELCLDRLNRVMPFLVIKILNCDTTAINFQLAMRIPAQLLFFGSLFIPFTLALHESEVGLVDWHRTQIGVPLTHHHTLAPIFHRVDVGRNGSKSVVLSATQNNVLAAVDVIDGSVGMLFNSSVRRGVNGLRMLQFGDMYSRKMTQYRCSRRTTKARLPLSSNHNTSSISLLFSCCVPLWSWRFNTPSLLSSPRPHPFRKKGSLIIRREGIGARLLGHFSCFPSWRGG